MKNLVFVLLLSSSAVLAQTKPDSVAKTVPIPDLTAPAQIPAGPSYDKAPQPKGGTKALFNFLMQNLRYPPKAVADKVGGQVIVLFDIKADGSMANFAIEKGVRADLNAEALRVCKILPKWIPATLKGKPVLVRYKMPLMLYPPVAPAPVAKPKL